MNRRRFLAGGVSVLAAPLVAGAQTPRTYRLGFLSPAYAPTPTTPVPVVETFRQRLRELGYVEGQNLVIALRFAEGKTERLPALAAELVRVTPDVIVTQGSAASGAVKQATSTIPVVFGSTQDPVREGLVASLARPGGNLTGMAIVSDTDLIAKRLQLLREVLPRASRLAIVPMPRPHLRATEVWLKDMEAAARTLRLTLEILEIKDPSGWDEVFAAAAAKRVDALCPEEYSAFTSNRKRIADAALKHRIPTVFGIKEIVAAGGLLSYGTSITARWRRTAELVDMVLKGAKPADLPVEQPTKFELVINLKTAKALGLTIPPAVLARADEVIE